MVQQRRRQHFLVVSLPAQGNINPALQLAKNLSRSGGGGGAAVTFATTISGHRKMFPSGSPPEGPVSFLPYSDGYDGGFDPVTGDTEGYMAQIKVVGYETLGGATRSLAAQGRPVTCIIYTLLLPWAADLAQELGVPSVLFWIQPATVFGVYYHYFHGFDGLISSHRDDPPPPDLPSFMATPAAAQYAFVLTSFEEMFRTLDREVVENEKNNKKKKKKIKVLVNSFEELEKEQLAAVETMELIPVGPLLPSAYTDGKNHEDTTFGGDLLKPDAKETYVEWLNGKEDRSVVYVSFGSFTVLPVPQREEISRALAESRRPFLWAAAAAEKGKLVEWCSQVEVLSHRAVGCFVTHCGWNSTVESLLCGVPTVGLPQWTDQPTNARLAETEWGVGVRAEVNAGGLLEAAELRRCIELVMKDDGEIRRNGEAWSRRAREAVKEGGSSDRNLMAFVDSLEMAQCPTQLDLE
ncbi:unnamed protein product [Spirodela intermedia]|uniref:Glycosyltransferase n=1 Tax=Spirodela intermedia TaxID=51605 RepID=A0A7I8IRS2_SPIIN|nr:unnamed protein product [Spirodela intermedia]CAA6659864.1 unnamed protein product [Spirodela intermedia]